jgi:hypothetical protein
MEYSSQKDYLVNRETKELFNINNGMTNIANLCRLVHIYCRKNKLIVKELKNYNIIFRVDDKLSKALHLTETELSLINNANKPSDPGCMSYLNSSKFVVNCFQRF